MKKFFTTKFRKATGVFAILALTIGIGFFAATVPSEKVANAQVVAAHGDLHGWAYSSTIGWVSLNCAEGGVSGGNICSPTLSYRVSIDSYTFSGWAWSPNVGWISFNATDVAGCSATGSPAGAGNLNATAIPIRVTGWARVYTGTVASGADGCINLGLSGSSPAFGLTYTTDTVTLIGTSTTLPGTKLGGFAWGSENVGWLEFNQATILFNTVRLYARTEGPGGGVWTGSVSPTFPSSGGTFYLVWESTGMASCTSSASPTNAAWTGTKPVQNPTDWSTVMTNTAYPIMLPPNTGSSDLSYSFTITCTPVGGGTPVSDTVTVSVLGTATHFVDLRVNGTEGYPPVGYVMPSSDGGPVSLTWTSGGVSGCMADGIPADSEWTGSKSNSNTTGVTVNVPANTGSFDITQVYQLGCSSGSMTYADSVTITIPTALSCFVSPASGSITAGSPVSSTMPFTVIGGSTFPVGLYVEGDAPLTYTITSSSGGALPTTVMGMPTINTGTSAAVHISGPDITSPLSFYVGANRDGGACTGGTFTINPPGTDPGPGTGPIRPPWREF